MSYETCDECGSDYSMLRGNLCRSCWRSFHGPAFTCDEKLEALADLDGCAVRLLTDRMVIGHKGVVSTRKVGVHDCVLIGGRLFGGEADWYERVEVKQPNGRYTTALDWSMEGDPCAF